MLEMRVACPTSWSAMNWTKRRENERRSEGASSKAEGGHALTQASLLGVDADSVKLFIRELLKTIFEEIEPKRKCETRRDRKVSTRRGRNGRSEGNALDPLLMQREGKTLEVKVICRGVDRSRCRSV